MYTTYVDRGFTVLSIWGENEYGVTPEVDELDALADEYGLTMPVLADPDFATFYTFQPNGGGLPTQVLLEPGMKVSVIDNYIDEADIQAVLPE